MKRTLVIILAMIVCFGLGSCGKNNFSKSNNDSSKNEVHYAGIYTADSNFQAEENIDTNKVCVPYFGFKDQGKKYDESAYVFPNSDTAKASKDNPDYLITENNEGVCIVSYVGHSDKIIIPDYLDGKKVIKIGGNMVSESADDDGSSYEQYLPAFSGTYYKELHIPKFLKEISELNFQIELFEENTHRKLTVDKDNPYYSEKDGLLCSKDGKTALLYFGDDVKSYTFPDSIDTIDRHFGFMTNTIQNVTIEKNVKNIYSESWVRDRILYPYEEFGGFNDFTISGYKGTAAEKFANLYGHYFISLD